MNKAEALRRQYEADLACLQETCPHTELSEFMGEWWAPGHSTGRSVQVCKECDKVVHSRQRCWNCLEYSYDDQGFSGDGHKHAYGGHWCSEACADEAEARGGNRGNPISRNLSCRHCHKHYPRENDVTKGRYVGFCSVACAEEFMKDY